MRYEVYRGHHKVGHNCFPIGCMGGFPYTMALCFEEEDLLHDISNLVYSQADVARVNDNYGHDILGENAGHYLSQFKDICESENVDRVRTKIRLALNEVEMMLFKYTKDIDGSFLPLDDAPVEPTDYIMLLNMPRPFSETSARFLLNAVHEYIVSSVIEDWAGLVFAEGMSVWSRNKELAKENINRIRVTNAVCDHRVKSSLI